MRARVRFAAAALVVFALTAAGCGDLLSSLTPFGLGERGTDESQGTYAGAWSGPTSAAGQVTYIVKGNEVFDLVLTHPLSCGLVVEFTSSAAVPIQDGAFSSEGDIAPKGKIVLRGNFTSPDTASGTYTFSSLPATAQCPTAGQGTFTAEKTPPPNP